jgi:CheY-like chemotaxis protein
MQKWLDLGCKNGATNSRASSQSSGEETGHLEHLMPGLLVCVHQPLANPVILGLAPSDSTPDKGEFLATQSRLEAIVNGTGNNVALTGSVEANHNTILVVEDDNAIRRLALGALQSRGYRTLEASDGESGFVAFVNNQNDVDLVLTDVVMPVLSGPAMVEKILRIQPAARVMFITGTPEKIDGPCLEGKSYLVLPKPFSIDRLAASVQDCLENSK